MASLFEQEKENNLHLYNLSSQGKTTKMYEKKDESSLKEVKNRFSRKKSTNDNLSLDNIVSPSHNEFAYTKEDSDSYGDKDSQQENKKDSFLKVNNATTSKKAVSIIICIFTIFFTITIVVAITLLLTLKLICSDISPSAKEVFVTTTLESGQLKFIPSLFLSEEEIQSIVDKNSMKEMDEELDSALISISKRSKDFDIDGITIEEVVGSTFYGKVLIVNDPSRVIVGSTFEGEWGEYGKDLQALVKKYDALAGVNGGLYFSFGNSGSRPLGVLVSNGEIQEMDLAYEGLYIIGFDTDNILQIIDIREKSEEDVIKLVSEYKLRDAVTFQEEKTDKNNHFVKLIVNGVAREFDGYGSGFNPRTVIGQREDGAVVFLVTDGRGSSGHLGASANDLIATMKKYGCVNAANIDGGSSSCMYYDGKYEMTSVTFYYANSSWKLPDCFLITKR